MTRNADCCGSQVAVGVNAADSERYAEQERVCPTVVRACRCMARATVADDGTEAGTGALGVRCAGGVCTSTFGLP